MSKKKKSQKVDYEVFNYGPIKMEKIGREINISTNWRKKPQFEEYREQVAENRSNLKIEIDTKIKELVEIIKNNDPFSLLVFMFAKNCFIDFESYKESSHEGYECFVEYSQSLILSQDFQFRPKIITDETIEKYEKLINEMIPDVFWFFGSDPRINKKNHLENELRIQCLLQYLFVRGDSYPKHYIEMISEHYKEYNDFYENNFGLDSNHIIANFLEIKQQISSNLNHEIKNKDMEKLLVNGKFDQFNSKVKSLFEVKQNANLKFDFLKMISSKIGDNQIFKENKAFSLWPINDSIIYKKPLIEYDKKFYCFNPILMFRNIDYILESWIKTLDNDFYHGGYQNSRAAYLEKKGIEYLSQILKGANVYQNLVYDGGETDGLILFDNCIFIVEAKAGEFSTIARRGEFKKRDIEKLIEDAYNQAIRTKNYIDKNATPTFKIKDTGKIFELKNKQDYRYVFFINITLQKLGHIATMLSSLKVFNFIQGKEWIWSVFINDLRVIAELIESPSIFIHYLKRRIKAYDYPFHSPDELDFFMFYYYEGLFFENENLKDFHMLTPSGYTEKLDRYYDYQAGSVSSGEKPKLQISDEYKKLIMDIEATQKFGFTTVTTYLLDFDSTEHQRILDTIKSTKEISFNKGCQSSFTLQFDCCLMGLVVFITHNSFNFNEIDNYCYLKMYQTKYPEWIAIMIKYKMDGTRDLDFKIYNKKWQFDQEMEKKLKYYQKLTVQEYLKNHKKIGRNDICPCGTGLKYKKCCGR